MSSDQHHIDQHLQRYLVLLDEYAQLRKELSKVQSDIYHNIARANFSGERGLRYGQDQYDERMRASRRVAITSSENEVPNFAVARLFGEEGGLANSKFTAPREEEPTQSAHSETSEDEGSLDRSSETDQDGEKSNKGSDPLRWFGILTPMPLRTAQAHSIKVVEEVIPRLVTVNAEMHQVEIEIRRARTRRVTAETAKSKG
jgi:hypothetical protein